MDFLKLFQIIAAGIAGTTVTVLHSTGADKHKTIAGQIAGVLGVAAAVASATHDAITQSTGGAAVAPEAPTAANTP